MSEDEMPDAFLCSVCKLCEPKHFRQWPQVEFVSWAQCDNWTHLKFCTQMRKVNDGDTFLCPRCSHLLKIHVSQNVNILKFEELSS